MSDASGATSVPWALRGMVVASIVLPLLVFAGGAWLAWRATQREAIHILRNELAVVAEQTTRVLDTHLLLGRRINDLLGGLSDPAIIEHERDLHDKIAAMIAGLAQVTAIAITG